MSVTTKRELAIKITDRLGAEGHTITQQQVVAVMRAMIDEIADTLAQGESVVMRRFGTFEVRELKPKVGRNPKNPGENVEIPARAGVKFKPGKQLKAQVSETLAILRNRS